MKEFAREYLMSKSDEDKRVWLEEKVTPEMMWRMAEGNPAEAADITTGGKPIPLFTNVHLHQSDAENTGTEETH